MDVTEKCYLLLICHLWGLPKMTRKYMSHFDLFGVKQGSSNGNNM